MDTLKTYSYQGPVMQFDICVDRNWKAETTAKSKKQALNNLRYQYKRAHHLARNASITLTGKLQEG